MPISQCAGLAHCEGRWYSTVSDSVYDDHGRAAQLERALSACSWYSWSVAECASSPSSTWHQKYFCLNICRRLHLQVHSAIAENLLQRIVYCLSSNEILKYLNKPLFEAIAAPGAECLVVECPSWFSWHVEHPSGLICKDQVCLSVALSFSCALLNLLPCQPCPNACTAWQSPSCFPSLQRWLLSATAYLHPSCNQ